MAAEVYPHHVQHLVDETLKRLKHLIDQNDTHKEIAEACGKPRMWLWRKLTGKSPMTLDDYFSITEALYLNPDCAIPPYSRM